MNNLLYDHTIKLIYERLTTLYNGCMQGYKNLEVNFFHIRPFLHKKITVHSKLFFGFTQLFFSTRNSYSITLFKTILFTSYKHGFRAQFY